MELASLANEGIKSVAATAVLCHVGVASGGGGGEYTLTQICIQRLKAWHAATAPAALRSAFGGGAEFGIRCGGRWRRRWESAASPRRSGLGREKRRQRIHRC
ncbi:hypothetical protein [Oryza sativa Japonica Group]|uniref:Uncharacterized protein n=1 Tax=Oryza sativa subsp. japonica TaxID=39947 RepID=Q5ZCG8_ORYSJ|nr:hypothetical protein [Oryza sativa Japonica Group]